MRNAYAISWPPLRPLPAHLLGFTFITGKPLPDIKPCADAVIEPHSPRRYKDDKSKFIKRCANDRPHPSKPKAGRKEQYRKAGQFKRAMSA